MSKDKDIVEQAVDAYKNGDDKQRSAIIAAAQKAGQRFLTDEEFNKRFEHGIKIAKDRGDDEMMMQFWVYGLNTKATDPKERDLVMPVMMGNWAPKNDEEKRMILMGLGAKIADDFPDHMITTIVHIAEAWMAKEQYDKEGKYVMPSENPERKEVVMVHAVSMDQRQSYWQGEIIKDENGKFKKLKKIVGEVHDPNDPVPLNKKMVDKLSVYIFMGSALAKEKKGEPNGKTGQHKNDGPEKVPGQQ